MIVQTYWPDHPAIQAAAQHEPRLFYEEEERVRAALGYPPFGRLANILVLGRRQVGRRRLPRTGGPTALVAALPDTWSVLGPSPAPISRLKGVWRWHILVKAPLGARISRAVLEVERALPGERVGVSRDRRGRGRPALTATKQPTPLGRPCSAGMIVAVPLCALTCRKTDDRAKEAHRDGSTVTSQCRSQAACRAGRSGDGRRPEGAVPQDGPGHVRRSRNRAGGSADRRPEARHRLRSRRGQPRRGRAVQSRDRRVERRVRVRRRGMPFVAGHHDSHRALVYAWCARLRRSPAEESASRPRASMHDCSFTRSTISTGC